MTIYSITPISFHYNHSTNLIQSTIIVSFGLFRQILFKFILSTFLSIFQILKQPDNIRFQQSKSFRATDRYFFFLDFLQLIDPITDIDPASGGAIFDYGIGGVLFGGHFVDGSTVTLEDLASIAGADSSGEH